MIFNIYKFKLEDYFSCFKFVESLMDGINSRFGVRIFVVVLCYVRVSAFLMYHLQYLLLVNFGLCSWFL